MERRRSGARFLRVSITIFVGAVRGSRLAGSRHDRRRSRSPTVRPSPVGRIRGGLRLAGESFSSVRAVSKPGERSGTAHRVAKRPRRACLRVTTRSVRGRLCSGEGSARTEKVREGSASSVLKRHRRAVRRVGGRTEAGGKRIAPPPLPSLVARTAGVVVEGIRDEDVDGARGEGHGRAVRVGG